ncbi:oxidative damage protection protein [Reinekea sp. G2M2-21]|uniref:oxidative damage protection protein n=1 Tax=Reinekea sp. G2M2-21 TaxID=2788942 RepID=UPI0018A9D85D|nr:oxidative damage protection protein [Reinekea sp. G2M2-21]MDX1343023.1 oxidative damage protection protein [Reinekea sp.]
MSRTVLCTKYNEELEGLTKPPFPGPKGQKIFDQVSAKAWHEWQEHQTRLINEKQLVMTDPAARKFLMEQMDKFLAGEDFEQAEGYVPDTKE